jgi:hypothetical protein
MDNQAVPSGSVSMGKSIYVSDAGDTIANGAVRYSISNHFSLLAEAKSVASAGDSIFVHGGTHTPNTNLYVDGVTYYFLGNPTINNNQRIFNDNGVPGTCRIVGDANFSCAGGVFNFSADTEIEIECENAITTSGVAFQLIGTKGNITVNDTAKSGSGATFYIDGATEVIVNAKNITGDKTDGKVFNIQAGFSGKMVFNSDLITATGSATNLALFLWAFGALSVGEITINVSDKIQITGTGPAALGTGIMAIRPDNGKLTINGTIDGGTGFAIKDFTPVQGSSFCHNGDAYNDGTLPLVYLYDNAPSACDTILNGNYTSSNADVILCQNTGSTLYIDGKIENTKVNGGASGVRITAHTATIFNNCKIIMAPVFDGSERSVIAVAPQNIKVIHSLSTNLLLDANITSLIKAPVVDANVE